MRETLRRWLGGLVLRVLVQVDEILLDFFWNHGYGTWEEE